MFQVHQPRADAAADDAFAASAAIDDDDASDVADNSDACSCSRGGCRCRGFAVSNHAPR